MNIDLDLELSEARVLAFYRSAQQRASEGGYITSPHNCADVVAHLVSNPVYREAYERALEILRKAGH